MSRSISITVPVRYEVSGKEYELIAVVGDNIIGKEEGGTLTSFDWTNGNMLSYIPSGEELKEASENKVRRNFWARRLVGFWTGKASADAVKGAFAADDLTEVFEDAEGSLKLMSKYDTLCDVLINIVED